MIVNRNGDCCWSEKRDEFEKNKNIYESVLLKFTGVKENEDVYNCSIPFEYGGKRYIFGRVEPHDKWASSRIYIFEETSKDTYNKVENVISYQLEDPFFTIIDNELVLGGVSVIKSKGEAVNYRTYFYRGNEPFEPTYFTTGPDMMKDIRLVQLPDGIGVFSRPDGYIGFTVIKDLSELDDKIISEAPIIDFISGDSYGGLNQCHYLSGGMIGMIGHMVYPKINKNSQLERVYINIAAVFDPNTKKTVMNKIIGTRRCYPESAHVRMGNNGVPLDDCAFTSGIVMREDGKVDLYSGLSDALEGRITIDNPFEGYGNIVYNTNILK